MDPRHALLRYGAPCPDPVKRRSPIKTISEDLVGVNLRFYPWTVLGMVGGDYGLPEAPSSATFGPRCAIVLHTGQVCTMRLYETSYSPETVNHFWSDANVFTWPAGTQFGLHRRIAWAWSNWTYWLN